MKQLDMKFNYEKITYGEIKDGEEQPVKVGGGSKLSDLAKSCGENERMCDAAKRLYGKSFAFNHNVIRENDIFPTQSAAHSDLWTVNGNHPSIETLIHAQTFPEDFDFVRVSWSKVSYVCGMSVPQLMLKRVVTRLIESGVFDEDIKS